MVRSLRCGKPDKTDSEIQQLHGFKMLFKRETRMRDMLLRALTNITNRIGGPMTFRIVLQPLMAALLAMRAGVRDAHEGRPAYLWTILTTTSQRGHFVREGWKAIARVRSRHVEKCLSGWSRGKPGVLRDKHFS